MDIKIADKNLDYIAGLLRMQISIAQNLQITLENDQLEDGLVENSFQMLSRVNREILNRYELSEWPRSKSWLKQMN